MARSGWLAQVALACGLAGALHAGENGVADGLNRFAASAYNGLAKSAGGNLVFSPFSIASVLSMALDGARGQTAAEMAKVLGQSAPDPAYHAAVAALVEQLTKAANTGGNVLLNANGLWVQKGFAIQRDFRGTIEDIYRAPLAQVDFAGNPEAARAEINTWADQHTRGKIRELFAARALNSSARLVLGSAVYFYGKWERPFRHEATRPAPFTPGTGSPVQTDFMNQTGRFGYAETAAGQTLEMRYAGTGLAFDILLPRKTDGIGSVEGVITPEKLTGWLGSLENRTVQVAIPKFRVESAFSLAPALAAMGMPSALNGSADFSGIDDRKDLFLLQVVHKAYVDVAEEGTEAAAATGGTVSLVSMPVVRNPVFRADHPFVFLIRDTRSGLILFAGRVSNPKP